MPDLQVYALTALEIFPRMEVTDAARRRLSTKIYTPAQDVEKMGSTGEIASLRAVYSRLYDFQKEASDRLVQDPKPGQMLVLSPGLGKTLVSLLSGRRLRLKSVLVFTIKDLVSQWVTEEQKWFAPDTRLVRLEKDPPLEEGWYVTNWDTVVGKRLDTFLRHWDLVIVDESVLVKNRQTRRFKSLLKLRPFADRWWELTGSPSTRYADDLWTQLHLCEPGGLRSFWRFANRYTWVDQGIWGTVIEGSREDRDLNADFSDLMFVRNQAEVYSQLPQAIPQLVEVTLTRKQLDAYSDMLTKFTATLDNGVKVQASTVLAQLIRLQQITTDTINIGGEHSSCKADAIVDMITARSFDFPCVIWTNWLPSAGALKERLLQSDVATKLGWKGMSLRVDWVHGATSDKGSRENEEKLARYKAGETDILILSIPVGRFGQNLQNTRTMVYLDKTWAADDYVQSLHRVLRIGLKHSPLIITLKAMNTIDDLVESNLAGKLPSISKISNADLASILRNLTGVP
jgi:SNF2 family DNA or RNA helicase